MIKQFREVLSIEMEISYRSNDPFGWIDEMDSEWLTNALRSLSGEEKELLTMLVEENLSQEETAKRLGKNPSWVIWKKKIIREKLEKEKANYKSQS